MSKKPPTFSVRQQFVIDNELNKKILSTSKKLSIKPNELIKFAIVQFIETNGNK